MFRFIPQNYNYIVFDLDKGHNDGLDGIQAFFDMLEILEQPCPSWLYSLETIPFYVKTPRGGIHLYFKTDIKYKYQNFSNGIEIKAGLTTITTIGSEKKEGKYKQVGKLKNIPLLPYAFTKILKTQNQEINNTSKNMFKNQFCSKKQYKNIPSLDLLLNWSLKDAGTGRNNLCFTFALKASKYYTLEEIRTFLHTRQEINGLPIQELQTATESGYRRNINI